MRAGIDEIRRLRAELAKVTAERDNMAKSVGVEFAECVSLRARVKELEAALRPFAGAAPLIEHAKSTFGIWARCSTNPGDSYTITVQHIRDAADALIRHKL